MPENSQQERGKTRNSLEISLAGRVTIAADGVSLDEARFPGRQGRLVFAYLVAEHGRPVPREELAEALWDERPPATWEKALTVIVSKLRALLEECGLDGARVLTSAFGCYRLQLPEGSRVDLIDAARAADEAAAALAAGNAEEATAKAARAASLARLQFLPGEDGSWVEAKRRELADVLANALNSASEACLALGDTSDAVRWAEEAVRLEPYRESGYRRLMQAHAVAGNRAEALRIYERCRRFLADELGAYPSPETESVYRQLLERPVGAAEAAPREEAEREPVRSSQRAPSRWSKRRVGLAMLVMSLLVASAVAVAGANRLSRKTVHVEALRSDRCSPVVAGSTHRPQVLIAADLPLQRGLLSTTRPMVEAMTLVLERRDYKAGRFNVALQVCDDAAPGSGMFSETTCAANARTFAANRSVIGIVGPFNSACAGVEIPILNRAPDGPLAIVSPSNTYVGLTRRNSETAPGEPGVYYPSGPRNYARTIAADDVQGAADAILARRLNVGRAYVLDDTGAYGVALASEFDRIARKLGIAIVGRTSWDVDANSYAELAATIAKTRPDGVFLSGASTGSSVTLLTDLRKRLGRGVTFLAPDGFDPSTVAIAASAAEGMALSRPGVPNERLGRAGKQFVASFSKKVGAEPTGFALHAAQAMDVLLDAIERSDGTRASVTEKLFSTRISNGILGSFWITASGDTTLNTVTIYRVVRGKITTFGAIDVPDDLVRGT